MDNNKPEETKAKVPTPRVLVLSSGQQVIASIYVTEGSDFIRLNEPYKIRIHENAVDSETYYVEERMSLTPWMFQTIDKVYSVHKNHIVSIGMPNQNFFKSLLKLCFARCLASKRRVQRLGDSMIEYLIRYFDIADIISQHRGNP